MNSSIQVKMEKGVCRSFHYADISVYLKILNFYAGIYGLQKISEKKNNKYTKF